MRNVFAVFFLSLQVVSGQSPRSSEEPGLGNSQMDRRYQEMIMERWALDSSGGKQLGKHREADAQIREFYEKAQHFVVLWQTFARELNDGKTFNAKLAKQVSKAFHDLEKSDGWPVGRSQ